jgi:hypothetical protein
MHRPHTNPRRQARAAAALTALIALSACGSDDPAASESSTLPTTEPADTGGLIPSTAPDQLTKVLPTTKPADTGGLGSASDEQAIALAALLQPDDVGEGWRDYGPDSAFPMTAELAASVPSCAPFVDVVFEGNAGVWASTGLGRDLDIAFTSITVFPTAADAAAMVAATATPEFEQCWADFNEVAVVELPFGIESASYEPVEPPAVKLGGDSSSLHALGGTVTLGSTELADSCVCAFVQQGRTVVVFHSSAPLFDAAERAEVIATALDRVDETVG